MFRSITTAGFAAMLVMATALPSAHADGFSITLHPRGKSAQAISNGLRAYSLIENMKNRAKVTQRGSENGAAIRQEGSGNKAIIFQKGRGNTGTITQQGNNNTFGLIQIGRKNRADVVQNGNGRSGLRLQFN